MVCRWILKSGGREKGQSYSSLIHLQNPSGHTLYCWGRSEGWDKKKGKKSSLLTMHFIQTQVRLLPLSFKLGQNVSRNGTLFIHLAWNVMYHFYLLPKPFSGSWKMSYILCYYILFLYRSSSSSAFWESSSFHTWVTDLVFRSVDSVFFHLKSKFKFCCFFSVHPCLPSPISK